MAKLNGRRQVAVMRTSNKVWFITGCARGLGRALAEAVLAAGDRLVATARRPEELRPLIASDLQS